MGSSERFDQAYYQRFYLDPRTAVTSRIEMRARARLISAFVDHIGLPVARILDAGCGVGLLRTPLRRHWPRAEYVGLETSEYLCARYGWQHGSLATWRASKPFDLVICYDVLQYLDDRDAPRALANLGRLCRGILYMTALTKGDWQRNCDQARTDRDVHLRTADCYRARLARAFRPIGAGFWIRRGAPLITWELELA
ncbi:MAG TPA: class I SAM-dependent methyltransferase [Steroidobacteraceae bacterium]|nr:class I SAM-dependent methyltransferase [Steroidobacteraceae bacterium]HRX89939.1 class I SAM-dependent methyltransferase [Steroidobacteraceae bacterium]